MASNAEIQAAAQAVELATNNYNLALSNYNSSTFWERIDGSRKKKVNMAKTALDEAQEKYMQTAAVSASEAGFSSTQSTVSLVSYWPIVLAVVIGIGLLFYIVQKRKK